MGSVGFIAGFVVVFAVALVAGAREWRRLGRTVPSPAARLDSPPTPSMPTRRAVAGSTPDPWVDPGMELPRNVEAPHEECTAIMVRPVLLTPPPSDPPLLPPHLPCPAEADDLALEHDFPWWDESKCWGCERECKRRAFRPYAAGNVGAKIRGAGAERSRRRAEEPYNDDAPHPRKRQIGRSCSADVDRLWADWCAMCGETIRRVISGEEPAPGTHVACAPEADGCPF